MDNKKMIETLGHVHEMMRIGTEYAHSAIGYLIDCVALELDRDPVDIAKELVEVVRYVNETEGSMKEFYA